MKAWKIIVGFIAVVALAVAGMFVIGECVDEDFLE